MDVTRQIQVAIILTDMWLCAALPWFWFALRVSILALAARILYLCARGR